MTIAFLHFLGFLLRPLAPVRVIDGRILQQGGEHEHEAHHEINVDGLNVGDSGERRPDSSTDGGHGEHGGYACGDEGR